MWSGAAMAAEENLEVQSTNLLLDFEGRSVLYTIQSASQITIAQYVTQNDIESEHNYDDVDSFADGATAGWRGCTGLDMCIDSSVTGASGSGDEIPTAANAYTNAQRQGPGGWHTEGVVSDEAQKLTGYAQECTAGSASSGTDFSDTNCVTLNDGSRLIWVHHALTGDSAPSWSGAADNSVEFDSTNGTGDSEPAESNSTTGTAQLTLYDFDYSGEFKVEYDLVVELSVKHQLDGEDKRFRLFQVIWGDDNDATGGNDDSAVTAAGDGTGSPNSLWTKSSND